MGVVLASQSQITKYITRSTPLRAMTSSYSKSRRIINKRFKDCISVDIVQTTNFLRINRMIVLIKTLIKLLKKLEVKS